MIEKKMDKQKLELKSTKHDGIKVGIKSDGKKYSVRDDRSRYFFPDEWYKFISEVKSNKQTVYWFLLHTGARIDEAINVKVKDLSFERNLVTLRVTKMKAKKSERIGRKREFEVSEKFMKELKKYIKTTKLSDDNLLFTQTKQAVYQLFRRTLQKAGIKDWYNFSLHNIRKTHGMWLKILIPYARGLDIGEICLRLGHDYNTYLKHYGSPSIFVQRDINQIIKIYEGIYGIQ